MSGRAQTQLVPPTTSQVPAASPPGISFVSGISVDPGGRRSPIVAIAAVADREHAALRRRRLGHGLEQVLDHAMGLRGHADPPPVRDEVEDHAGGGVGLARPGRTLDREHRVVQAQRQRPGAGRHVGAVGEEGAARRDPVDPRRNAEDEVARGTVRPRPVEPVLDHVVGEPEQRPAHRLRTVRPGRDQGHGMRPAAPLEVHDPGQRVQRHHADGDRVPARPVGLRHEAEVSLALDDLGVLGGIERVAVHHGPRRHAPILDESQPAQRRAVRDQVIHRRIGQPVVIPPLGLGLAAVPVQQRGQQPPALLLRRPFRAVHGHAQPQRVLAATRLGHLLAQLLGRLAVLPGRPRDLAGWIPLGVGGQRLVPACLQPVPEEQVRDAIVTVVGGDLLEDGRIAALHPPLVLDHAEAGLRDRALALRHVERLELLDRVALDARTDALADDVVVEVHQHVTPQQDGRSRPPVSRGAASAA